MNTYVKLNDFLNQLKDQKWHSLRLLSTKLTISVEDLQKMAETLRQKNIIHLNPETKWVKLNPEYTSILTDLALEEKPSHDKAILASIIIPPKQDATIQELHLTNMTQETLEIHIRMCMKPTEIGIDLID